MFGKWQKAMNHFYMNNEARTDNIKPNIQKPTKNLPT